MIVPDANLLIYAYNTAAPEHRAAKQWLENAFSSPELIGLSWQVVTAFLHITTNLRIFAKPFTAKEAADIVEDWLAQPQVRVITPTEDHWNIFSTIIVKEKIAGPLIIYVHLATLTIEHGATLATTDRDFSRFSKLKVIYPI